MVAVEAFFGNIFRKKNLEEPCIPQTDIPFEFREGDQDGCIDVLDAYELIQNHRLRLDHSAFTPHGTVYNLKELTR